MNFPVVALHMKKSKLQRRSSPAAFPPLAAGPMMTVPIPCLSCELGLIPVKARDGSHSIRCPRCRKATNVIVYSRNGKWLVRTEMSAEAV